MWNFLNKNDMEDKYYVIWNSDGDTTVTEMTKAELIDNIEERAWVIRFVWMIYQIATTPTIGVKVC